MTKKNNTPTVKVSQGTVNVDKNTGHIIRGDDGSTVLMSEQPIDLNALENGTDIMSALQDVFGGIDVNLNNYRVVARSAKGTLSRLSELKESARKRLSFLHNNRFLSYFEDMTKLMPEREHLEVLAQMMGGMGGIGQNTGVAKLPTTKHHLIDGYWYKYITEHVLRELKDPTDSFEADEHFALIVLQWLRGQQAVYLIEPELHENLRIPVESPKKFEPIKDIMVRRRQNTEKLKHYADFHSHIEDWIWTHAKEDTQWQSMMAKEHSFNEQLSNQEGWVVPEIPELKTNLDEPILLINPDGSATIIAQASYKSVVEFRGWSNGLKRKNSAFIENRFRQIAHNSHALVRENPAIFYVGTCAEYDGNLSSFMFSTVVPQSKQVRTDLPLKGKYGNGYNFENDPRYDNDFDHEKFMGEVILPHRAKVVEGLCFLAALQSPKSIVTKAPTPSKSRKGKKKNRNNKRKKRSTQLQPKIFSIEIDSETLSLICPVRFRTGEKTGRTMPNHERRGCPAKQWVTRENLRVGEVVIATKKGKRDNTLYYVQRERVGTTVNEHLPKIPKTEKLPKVTRAKEFNSPAK